MSIFEYNGSAVVAMVGKNCFAIASDRRLGVQLQTVATDFQRVFKIHPKLYIGLSGLATDAQTLYQRLVFKHKLYQLREERDKFIELSGAEMQNLRLANWQLAQANSQMLAELNLGKNRLKSLQHELTCSRAALKVKSSELEEAKKVLRSSRQQQQKSANEMARQLAADRAAAAQLKDGYAEPGSDALHAASANKPACNANRKRLMRSRSLGPAVAPTKTVAASKERESAQRRKSMRTPHPSGRREDLFEIEDVQVSVSSGNDRKETSSCGQESSVQFPRRSSLGRPLRRATWQFYVTKRQIKRAFSLFLFGPLQRTGNFASIFTYLSY